MKKIIHNENWNEKRDNYPKKIVRKLFQKKKETENLFEKKHMIWTKAKKNDWKIRKTIIMNDI